MELPSDLDFDESGEYVVGRGGVPYKKRMRVTQFQALKPQRKGDPQTPGAGRKPITEVQWNAYLDSLRVGSRYTPAAIGAGISYSTVKDRRKADPAFAQAEREAEAEAAEVIEDVLFELAKKGNFMAATKWLDNRMPDRWQNMTRPQKVVIEGTVTHTHELQTVERIAALENVLRARREAIEGPKGVVIDVESEEL